LFPELSIADAGSFVEDSVPTGGQHQNLAAMMRLVREHVANMVLAGHVGIQLSRENFATRRFGAARGHPTHAQALRGASPVRGGSLLHRAPVGSSGPDTSDAEL